MENNSLILLQVVEKRANILMYKNHEKLFHKKYDIQIIENIMCNDACHIVAVFKDYLIADDNSEYLRRIYKKNESIPRLIKLFSYYEETSVIFPNYTPLVESKYLYNNVIRKQRVIDEQQNLEEYKKYLENKEKKKSKKNSPLKAIENIFKQDSDEEEDSKVFNSKAYDEILNTTESVKRIIFGIEANKTKNLEDGNESIKDLLTKIENLEHIKEKNKDNNNEFANNVRKKLKYAAQLLENNKNDNKKNSKIKSKDKNNKLKKTDKKDHSSSLKKNRTININININNTKNSIAMTDRPYTHNNNNSKNIINNNFPLSTKGIIKDIIFNQKKINSAFPYQLFRNSNVISNLNKKNKNKNNNLNNNSINSLQQKLMEIFNKKIKKNKNNNRNNSYNLSLCKKSNANRLRTKNKAFIINTIQNTILYPKPKRNHSINVKSDKNIYINKNKENNNSNSMVNKKIKENYNQGHKRIKSNNIININNNSNLNKENISRIKKNLNKNYSSNNKPLLTISPSLKKRNIFGFKTMSKLTETIYDYKPKNIYKRNSDFSNNLSHSSQNKSLKNKTNIQAKIGQNFNNIFSYKSKNNNIYSINVYKFKNI